MQTREAGTAQLINGDALTALAELAPESVDALITDPPYSSGGMFRGDRVQDTGNKYLNTGARHSAPSWPGDTRDQRAYALWCERWLSASYRALKWGGVVAVFCDWRQLPTVSDAIQVAGFVLRGILVWDKTEGTRPVKGWHRQQSEFVLTASKGPRIKAGPEAPTLPGVVRCAPRKGEKLHQVGKPVPLMDEVIRLAPEGGTVLDPFMGSATTGVAAVASGRAFVGIEIDPHYYTVASDRLAKLAEPA